MSGYEFKVTFEDGEWEIVVMECEEDVWVEYGDEVVSVECVGIRVAGVSI